jgi:coatomer protein complex subunit gamma
MPAVMMPRDKKAEELGEFGIFTNINKGNVVQDSRVFSDTPLSPKRCVVILAKTLYLLGQGEQFNEKEATTVFFASTKSFQCKDVLFYFIIHPASSCTFAG